MNARSSRYALLIATVCVVYLSSFQGAFQFDDYNVIVNNPAVHSLSAWLSGLLRGIRPLLKLTYTLNWTSGMGVFGFHLFNLVVHAANTILIYLLTRRFFDRSPSTRSHAEFSALATALLFALHPIQTEAVTYISGRSMSLMALLYLGSMLAYVSGADSGRKTLLYAVSPVLFIAAVAVKETALTLPFALALWEAGGGSANDWKDALRRQTAHWGVLACLVLVLLVHPSYPGLMLYGLEQRSMGDNLLSQSNGISTLLSRFVLVHRLNIDPGLPVVSAWTPELAAETVFLLTLLGVGLAGIRKRPWIGFGLLWFFLHILPTNSLLPRLDVANERHLYIAGWGIFLAVSGELARVRASGAVRSETIKAVLAAACLVLGLFTVMRNHEYRSEVSLWEDTVGKSPDNARAHNNLGYAYFHAGRTAEALAEYRSALRLRPGYERARENLASLTYTLERERTQHTTQ